MTDWLRAGRAYRLGHGGGPPASSSSPRRRGVDWPAEEKADFMAPNAVRRFYGDAVSGSDSAAVRCAVQLMTGVLLSGEKGSRFLARSDKRTRSRFYGTVLALSAAALYAALPCRNGERQPVRLCASVRSKAAKTPTRSKLLHLSL